MRERLAGRTSPGAGSALHLSAEMFQRQAGASMFHLPYKGKTRSPVAGLHFFMPAHLVPLVEIVSSDATDLQVAEASRHPVA